ncbi:MAG: energy transducer TonB [Cyclobacteriaceae bacterium]|nr:energy transducer TonB [Cyclobacteriaceae bacterium]
MHSYEPKLQFEASVKLYYPSGKVREQGIIKNEDRVGFHRYWYESGQLQKEVIYTPGAKEKYIQFYSAEGKPLLTNSTGEFQEIDNSNTTVEVRDSVVVAVYVREGSDVIYLVVDQPAEYKGGLPAMYRQLSSSLRVPKEIRQSRSIARVYVKFVVDESGKSSRHEIIKGFSPACDAEALKGTKTLNKWKPARHKGKVVKSSFVLPVVFRSE